MVVIRRELPRTNIAGPARGLSLSFVETRRGLWTRLSAWVAPYCGQSPCPY
jgi:hypothetical protein